MSPCGAKYTRVFNITARLAPAFATQSGIFAMAEAKIAILFVCLGNICRSPMAEGLARMRFDQAGIAAEIDSAGIGNWHEGEPADRRAVNASWKVLVDLSALRARQIQNSDFERFEYIVAMDNDNVTALEGLAGTEHVAKISRLLDFTNLADRQITDPYYGGHDGFDQVVARLDIGIAGLIRHIKEKN